MDSLLQMPAILTRLVRLMSMSRSVALVAPLLALGIQEAVVLLATETRAQEGRVVVDSHHVTVREARVGEDLEAVLGVTTIRHEEALVVDQEAIPPLPQTKSSLFL